MTVQIYQSCYKKWKTFVFGNPSLAFALDSIADFECDQRKMDDRFINLANSIETQDFAYFHSLVKKVHLRALPKSFASDDESVPIVNSGWKASRAVESVNFFIELPVELGIVDTLFTLGLGFYTSASDCWAANTFAKGLFQSRTESFETSVDWDTNHIFAYYFKQYVLWHNGAVDAAKKSALDRRQDCSIYSIDLQRYFYNIDLDWSVIPVFAERQLTMAKAVIQKVYQAYGAMLSELFPKVTNRQCLPIGCPSSCALSNLYLLRFDEQMKSSIGTGVLYYSRYVDDILIVKKGIEKSTDSIDELCKCFSDSFSKNPDGSAYLVGFPNLIIQAEKLKIVRIHHRESKTFLTQLSREVPSPSTVRLLSNGDVSIERLAQLIQEERRETLKIRDTHSPRINVANVSRYLSAYLQSRVATKEGMGSKLKTKDNGAISELFRCLEGPALLHLFLQWPLIFTFLKITKGRKGLEEFGTRTQHFINRVSLKLKDKKQFRNLKLLNQIVKETLTKMKESALAKAGALLCPSPNDNSSKYRNACLFDMRFVAIRMAAYMTEKEMPSNLFSTNFEILFGRLLCNLEQRKMVYSTQFIHLSDYAFGVYIDKIGSVNGSPALTNEIYENYLKLYQIAPHVHDWGTPRPTYTAKLDPSSRLVSVTMSDGTSEKGKYRLILGNINLREHELLDKKTRKIILQHLSFAKKIQVFETLKQAALLAKRSLSKDHPSPPAIIVFPEFYLPLEWLDEFALFARVHQVAIVTGIRYVRHPDNRLQNLVATILPSTSPNGFRSSAVFLREKNFYAPEEEERIESNGYSVIDNTDDPLLISYKWQGLNFVPYICYELTDICFRALCRGQIDLVIGVEWNKDVSYFDSIGMSVSRDLHVFFAQTNDSYFGGTRIISPTNRHSSNVAAIKGGEHDAVISAVIDVATLRKSRKKDVQREMMKKKGDVLEAENKIYKDDKELSAFHAPSANSEQPYKT